MNEMPLSNSTTTAGQRPVVGGYLYWLAFLFVGAALAQLQLAGTGALRPDTFLPLLVLAACVGVATATLRRRNASFPGDPILLPVTFFLSGFGLVLITRLAPAFITRQIFWLAIATGLLLSVALIPKNLNWLYRYKYTWLIGGLVLLASTLLFGVNPSGFGARLWLPVGGIYFQPSELLKLLLLVFLAAYLADRRRHLIETRAHIGPLSIPHPAYWGPMLLMWGFSIILLVWQRDLGAALLFFCTFLGMVYAATGKSRYLWAGALLLLAAGVIGYILFDVVRLRVDGFLDPWADPAGRSFQIVQSLLAFASGGVIGQGLGQGLPTAIPVVHTDFVFAAIGEEYGLLGALGVLLCFALLIGRAFHIAIRARSEFEQLLAAGIGTLLGLQTIVITAGTLKLIPLTGVTLPFVSYGGSSLLVSFVMVGLLVFIANKGASLPEARAPALARKGPRARATQYPLHPIYHFKLARGIFTGLLIVAGGLILWQVLLAPLLVSRRDNPRPVVAQQKIERGRILTRDGIPVAETIFEADGLARRHYPYPDLSSVTGYYSIRHGTGGTEAAFDPTLRGTLDQTAAEEFSNSLFHRPLVGEDVTLSIDLPAQAAADVALGNQEGAVVVLDVETGAVLVMSGHPTYDPNLLDKNWDDLRSDQRAPLLNRATQGLFPVGDLARLVGVIGLQEAGASLPVNPQTTPLDTLTGALGSTGYLATAHQLGFARPFAEIRSQSGLLPDFPPQGKETVRDLAVTPLHLARVIAGLELDGYFPNPTLLLAGQTSGRQAIRPDSALAGRALLSQVDEQVIGFSGEATPKETGQQTSLNWFVGLAPATLLPLAEPAASDSAAISDKGLILDPTRIKALPATPSQNPDAALENPAPETQNRYAVVAVVVTDAPDQQPALRIVNLVLNILLRNEE